LLTCGSAADLDITGPTARIRFLNEADAEYAVLEGGDGWLNTTARVVALDYVAGETSLVDVARRLSSVESSSSAPAAPPHRNVQWGCPARRVRVGRPGER